MGGSLHERGRLWILLAVLSIVIAAGVAAPAAAEPRIALVITNQNYTQPGAVLTNTHRDGDLVKAALEAVGFKVWVERDTSNEGALTRAVGQHVERLTKAGPSAVGFLYYSGHGAADRPDGANYPIPTEVPITHVSHLPLMAVRLDKITASLSKVGKTSFVVFDACRNMALEREDKDFGFKGFAPAREERDLLVAYATESGHVAVDQSIYAKALAEEIVKPGREAGQVFRAVTQRVEDATTPKQSPEFLDKRRRDFHFAAAAPREASSTKQPEPPMSPAGREWQDVKGSSNRAVLEAFLKKHQNDQVYSLLAEEVIGKLSPSAPALPAPEPPAKQASILRPMPPASCTSVEVHVAGRGKVCLDPTKPDSREFQDCVDVKGRRVCGPKMVVIPRGRFLMGSSDAEIAALIKEYRSTDPFLFRREAPEREITIAQPFAAGLTHVTRGELRAFVMATGHKIDGGCWVYGGKEWKHDADRNWLSAGIEQDDSHPVVCVDWHDAQAYAAWLKKETGQPYRLLTEAESEYVARAVSTPARQPRYFFGNNPGELCSYGNGADLTGAANFNTTPAAPCDDGFTGTAPAGSLRFAANSFGVRDVFGNAWSWTDDCYSDSYKDAPADGSARTTGDCVSRVLRGGSWLNGSQGLRAANRDRGQPDSRANTIGFRLARTLSPPP